MRLRERELDIRALELQVELEKLRRGNGAGRGTGGGLGPYAKDLRAVLAPMPESDEMAPACFRSAESMLRSCEIPEDVRGSIILPLLNANSRMLIANRAESGVQSYEKVRDFILSELKLTPEEYRRRLYSCRKGSETWGQLATKLDGLLDYYLRSREVNSFEDLRALLISYRIKELMDEDMRMYVPENETGAWLKPEPR